MALLTTNTKIEKSNKKFNELMRVLQLAPGNSSGIDVCKFKSKQCYSTCIFKSGFGVYDNVKNGRIKRTKMFH